MPGTEAVTVTVPVFGPVVYLVLAMPASLVPGDVAENDPPAPLSVKVTVTPGTAFPYASTTFTTKGFGSGVLGYAD